MRTRNLVDEIRRRGGYRSLLDAAGQEALSSGIEMPSSSKSQRDPRVDAYIARLPAWQQDICTQLRETIHRADPAMTETIKRAVRPYFVLEGNVCALLAAKDHVNLFLYDGGIVPDPHRIITAGHDNKTARQIAYREGERIKVRPLIAMLKQIVANNRAGGWRRIANS